MIKFATLKGNRHKAAGVFSLMLAACLLLLLPGCQGPLDTRQDTVRTGALSLTIEGPPGQARTALPDGSLVDDFDRLIFTFTAGAGNYASFGPVTRPGDLGSVTIDGIPVIGTGAWSLTVSAYLFYDGDYEQVAVGSTNITVTVAGPNTGSVELDPYGVGTGQFAWDVTFPDIVTEVIISVLAYPAMTPIGAPFPMTIYDGADGWSTDNDVVTVTGYAVLNTGMYLVVFTLSDGDDTALPIITLLRVYRNMVSVFEEDFDFAPATPAERAIYAIDTHLAWAPVNQAWTNNTTDTVAAALANVQAQVDAVIAGLGATASVGWSLAAPTPGQTGAVAADIDFAVTVGTYSTTITVSVAFLPSHAQAALTAIAGALGTIQAPFTQGWLGTTEATLNAAIATVSGLVNTAITNATVIVSFDAAPTPVGSLIPEAPYLFNVAITGTDNTTGSTNVTVPITFAADGDVITDALVAAIAAATALFVDVETAPNGDAININDYWVTQAAYDALRAAITTAEGYLVGAGQIAVDAAVAALNIAMGQFVPVRGLYDPAITAALGALDAAIAAAQAVARANYTPASLATMDAALGNAVAAQGDRTLTVTQIDALRVALENARAGLVTLVAEARDALRPVIESAVARTPADYGPAVRLAFTNALAAAQTAYANAAATAGELNTARTNLETAMDNLVSLVSAREALQGIIDTALLHVQANYTPASWIPFAGALAAAQSAITTAETVADLQAAGTALSGAMGNLVPQESGNFTITWPGFTNQMASVGVNVVMNGAGGTLTVIGYGAAGLENIRWYEGLNRLGTGPILTRNNMPPVVTVWAEVDGRTYSLVVDVNNPPTGAGN